MKKKKADPQAICRVKGCDPQQPFKSKIGQFMDVTSHVPPRCSRCGATDFTRKVEAANVNAS